MIQDKKILVVGANSFLAYHLINRLLSWENFVVGVYNNSTANLNNSVTNIHHKDISLVKDTLFDFVFITAAYIPFINNVDRQQLFDVNVKLVETVSALFKNSKIIYCSSVSVYGNTNSKVICETSNGMPLSEYGVSKLWGEKLVEMHPHYSIVRISSIYGARMSLNTFIPRIISQALSKSEITIYGDGSRAQNYIYVEHVVDFLLKAAEVGKNDIYLAVAQESYTNLEIANYLSEMSGKKFVLKGNDLSSSLYYNNDYTLSELNYRPEVNFFLELEKLYKWMQTNLKY